MIHINILNTRKSSRRNPRIKVCTGNKNSLMSNSYSCCIFDAFQNKSKKLEFQSQYFRTGTMVLKTTYVLIVFTGKKCYVNCLPIAFNFEVISFLLNFLILLDVLNCSHLIILGSRRY